MSHMMPTFSLQNRISTPSKLFIRSRSPGNNRLRLITRQALPPISPAISRQDILEGGHCHGMSSMTHHILACAPHAACYLSSGQAHGD